MTSTVQVQRPKEQAQFSEAELGIRIVSVESKIRNISLTNPGRDMRGAGPRPFEFDVDLSESSRTANTLSVKYSFAIGRPASGQVFKMTGTAVLRFSHFDPGRDFHILGNDISNEIAVEIFRKEYEAIYLLHRTLGMDAPSPWITQDVSLSSRSREIGQPSDNP